MILYLVIRGRLPFDGRSKNEIIDKTVGGELPLHDVVWDRTSTQVGGWVGGYE